MGQFPKWNESFKFIRRNEKDIVHIEIFDNNLVGADTYIGSGAFSLCRVRKGKETG